MSDTEDLRAGDGAARRFRVTVTEGPDRTRVARIDQPISVGTSELCELRLTDRAVSRRHCTLEPAGARLLVRDAESRNGTWLGDVRIGVAEVPSDCDIRLGASTLRVEVDRFPVRAPEAAAPIASFGRFLGSARCLQPMYALLARVAQSDATVLFEGESGAGKELLAEALHDHSPRGGGPLVVVDCAALPETLIESTLFGHERGAFTGADRARAGAFEEAEGGTLFLDEIGELPLELQTRLLGVLDRRKVRRLGAERAIATDVRVIAATNRNLEREVEASRFRLDLFHRLAVVLVRIPPLRERSGDVEILARHFVAALGAQPAEVLSSELCDRLAHHGWPGNARELRNHVERLVLVGDQALGVEPAETGAPAATGEVDELAALSAVARSGMPYRQARSVALAQFTDAYVADMLRRHGGNVSQAAAAAGVARRHFHRLKRG